MGLIIDSFAGGGGASTGIEMAMGRHVDIAINHDMAAIRMHEMNHPLTRHYCEDVWEVDPMEATGGLPVDLMWLSPDCKHFSKAKGAKPVSKKVRGLAWLAVKWAKEVQPKVIILENVEEFKTWGPLDEHDMPCPDNKGKTFHLFIGALERHGYEVQHRELIACDYGAPTTRKRFFMIARCDGQPIVWPEPTHGDPDSLAVRAGLMKPWRTASEIIDWAIPCPSIFDRKKPLVEKTLQRIARGLQKFVIDDPDPFIVQISHTSDSFRGQPLNEPLKTITTRNNFALCTPFISQYHSYGDEARGQTVQTPLMTLDTSNRYAVVMPFMMHYYGTSTGASVKEPLATITSLGQHIAEVRAFLIKYYGQGTGQSLNDPLDTITTHDRFGLVTVKGEPYQIVDIGLRMLSPKELYAAQGFPADYIIDQCTDGIKMTKRDQVARVGNSVVPQIAAALVKANVQTRIQEEAI